MALPVLKLIIVLAICLLPLNSYSVEADQVQISEPVTASEETIADKTSVQEVVEQAAEKAAEKTADKAAKKAAASAAKKAAENAVQQAELQATEKAQIKATRPEHWKGPTRVGYRILLLDIDQIDDANQNFTVNVFLRLTWKDLRLANPEGTEREIPLEQVWSPQVLLANQQGQLSTSLQEIVLVQADGTVDYRQRYTGKLSQPLNLSDFPFDKHIFTIQFASAAYRADELEFVPEPSSLDPDIVGGTIAKQLSLPDWQILGHKVLTAPYRPIDEVQIAGFVFQFEAKRYIAYYLWQVVLPLTVVVVMSLTGFWVQRGQVAVRIGVATSSILTLIAYRFVLANLLPRLPYMTRLDYFTVGSTLLVLVSLLGVVYTSYLASINKDLLTKEVDLWARWTLPAAYIILLVWFFNV